MMRGQVLQYDKNVVTSLFISALRGFSQVLLVKNAFSGLLILIGISIFSPALGLMTLLASIIGAMTGKILRASPDSIQDGLYSFNSVLCAITPILFLSGGKRWFIAVLAAIIAAISMRVLTNTLDRWHIPVLTAPFIFITWIGLLIAYNSERITMDPDFIASSPSSVDESPEFLVGMVKGIGEVFVIDSLWTSLLILTALFVAGWRFGLFAVAGAFVSWITAYFMGVDVQSRNLGLYNYNAVLTGIAVGLVFNKTEKPTLITAIIAAMLTVPVTAAVASILEPTGLPALTFPFVLCTLLFVGIRKFYPNI